VRISGLAGSDAASKLIEVSEYEGRGMKVRGYLLPAVYARKGKRQQFVFLNGRPIEDPAISRALRDGYRGAITDGSFPAAWLWLEMDPTLVDVNVHPAKREVRFHRPHEVRSLIAEAVESALRPTPAPSPVQSPVATSDTPDRSDIRPAAREKPTFPENASTPHPNPSPSSPSEAARFPHRQEQQQELTDTSGEKLIQRPEFNLIGPLHDRYIVLEGDEGVVLLDPIAARERVVYEDLLRTAQSNDGEGISSQGLLVPELLDLEALDAELVVRHASHFSDAGMTVEAFGGSTVKVSSLPSFLNVSDIRAFLIELVDDLSETVGTRRGKAMAFETFAASLARRVGRREPCRIDHADALLTAMFACDLPYCTPDGRPTLIHISLNELDRKFGK